MNLIMVPQSWLREKVNRLKLKNFLIGHIYEVKIISINNLYVMPMLQTVEFGQNLAKRANFFFYLMVFSSFHLLGNHLRHRSLEF